VITGGFISTLQLLGRQMMSLFHPDYYLKEAPAWPPIEQGYFYGPHPFLRDAFRIGHITNSDFGYARPFIRLDPQSLVPHSAFLSLASGEGEPSHEIRVKTCWSRVMNSGQVIHGCQFVGNTVQEEERFIQGLRDVIGRLGRKAEILPRSRPAA
jgi:hypothetical protein